MGAFGLLYARGIDAHPGVAARRGSDDSCDAVFGGWSTRLPFTTLSPADDHPRDHIQICCEDYLAHHTSNSETVFRSLSNIRRLPRLRADTLILQGDASKIQG